MKNILLTAAGVVVGDINESKLEIKQLFRFQEGSTFTEENLKLLLSKNETQLIDSLGDFNEEIVSDNSLIVEQIRSFGYTNVRFASSGELTRQRSLVKDYLNEKISRDMGVSFQQIIRSQAFSYTKYLLKEKNEARDIYIAQAINSIDDINSILNLIYARLSEWYGIHFPELKDLVRDNDQYITLVSKTNAAIRTELTEDLLIHLSERRRELILSAAKESLGSGISPYDMKPIGDFANFGVEILKIKDSLEEYIEESMKEIAPNIQRIVGSLLGARLIALAGSLENLAKMSSGTIQVLGAEKALFRHLRSGEDPPKHGVIFQSPYIHSVKKHVRGKIARALAAKLTIAARVDYFTGEFIGDTLLRDLDNKVNEIKISNPEPSARQLEHKKIKKKKKPKKDWKKGKRPSWDKKGKRRKKR
ncbi:MAG: NOP5/NOP56 family protein [Candidatus Hodarchaeales archaeon]